MNDFKPCRKSYTRSNQNTYARSVYRNISNPFNLSMCIYKYKHISLAKLLYCFAELTTNTKASLLFARTRCAVEKASAALMNSDLCVAITSAQIGCHYLYCSIYIYEFNDFTTACNGGGQLRAYVCMYVFRRRSYRYFMLNLYFDKTQGYATLKKKKRTEYNTIISHL